MAEIDTDQDMDEVREEARVSAPIKTTEKEKELITFLKQLNKEKRG